MTCIFSRLREAFFAPSSLFWQLSVSVDDALGAFQVRGMLSCDLAAVLPASRNFSR